MNARNIILFLAGAQDSGVEVRECYSEYRQGGSVSGPLLDTFARGPIDM